MVHRIGKQGRNWTFAPDIAIWKAMHVAQNSETVSEP